MAAVPVRAGVFGATEVNRLFRFHSHDANPMSGLDVAERAPPAPLQSFALRALPSFTMFNEVRHVWIHGSVWHGAPLGPPQVEGYARRRVVRSYELRPTHRRKAWRSHAPAALNTNDWTEVTTRDGVRRPAKPAHEPENIPHNQSSALRACPQASPTRPCRSSRS